MTRMREQMLDVDLVIPQAQIIRGGGFEAQMTSIIRQARQQADERAASVGGEVRATQMPELVVRQAVHALLGDVFVIGSRWKCDVPERALTTAER